MDIFSINERVESIKGNKEEINRLVEEYKPFIASCVEKATGRYVRYGEDDELSIGLMAFVEAINSHDKQKGNFLTFAQQIITRRLIDYYRKEKRHFAVKSINEYYKEDDGERDFSVVESLDRYSKDEISEYRRLEILEFKKELSNWDITLFQLAEASPKHESTRSLYKKIVQFLLSQNDIIEQIKHKKTLPIAEIEKGMGIPRKKIERARRYIIAAIIIYTGDYQYIKEYLSEI
jgi:RNA polymerase sigma factor